MPDNYTILVETLFMNCRDAKERYTDNVKRLGEKDIRTAEALAGFKALYKVIVNAELESQYATWRTSKEKQKSQ